MASAERVEVMQASKESLLTVLKDYEAYSDYMDGVSKVTVLDRDGSKVRAEYDLNVIKKFSYILQLEESDDGISWSFEKGDIFSKNSGSWSLKDLGDGTTEVTYKVEVEIKIKMMGTGMITKKLVNTSLPSLMKAVEKKSAESLEKEMIMDGKFDEKIDEKDEKKLSDIFRKVVKTGFSAAFMTEDAVKGIIGDLPLPKEIVHGLLQNAKNTKEEFISSVRTELKNYLNKIDVSKEIDRVIKNYDLEISAKINLTPKEKVEDVDPKKSSKNKK